MAADAKSFAISIGVRHLHYQFPFFLAAIACCAFLPLYARPLMILASSDRFALLALSYVSMMNLPSQLMNIADQPSMAYR